MCGERSDSVGSSTRVLLMTGGSGTRLWPKSRKSKPKQFMSLGEKPSLFQQTLHRVRSLVPETSIYAVTPPEYLPHIQSQAPEIAASCIIVEPMQYSTTACLGYAMAWLKQGGLSPEDVVLVLPTDAYVGDDQNYVGSLREAIDVARRTNGIVTIGIQPNYPATGYGYIQCNFEDTADMAKIRAMHVKRFVEKPGHEEAEKYLRQGGYFWNAGMFAWKAATIWELFSRILPSESHRLKQIGDIFSSIHPLGRAQNAFGSTSPLRDLTYEQIRRAPEWDTLKEIYAQFPQRSFEFSIVEQAPEIYMVPGRFPWTDLGTWSVFIDKLGTDSANKDVVMMDAHGCLVDNRHGLVGLLGVDDLIVVNTKDTVFICHRDREQDVKQFCELLKKSGYEDYL